MKSTTPNEWISRYVFIHVFRWLITNNGVHSDLNLKKKYHLSDVRLEHCHSERAANERRKKNKTAEIIYKNFEAKRKSKKKKDIKLSSLN